MKRPFWRRLWDAASQLFNVLIYKDAEANHSISGDAYRYDRVRTRNFIDRVLGKDHCLESFENEIERAKAFLDEIGEI